MEPIWAATYLAASLPFAIVAGVSDLRTMTIPNWVSLCLLTVFIGLSFFAFPWLNIAFRLAVMIGVFAVLFTLNQMGMMGGGDAKLLTVMTPFVAAGDWFNFVYYLAVWSIVTVVMHRIVMNTSLKDKYFSTWGSFQTKKKFPFGLPIALGFICYLWSNATPFI